MLYNVKQLSCNNEPCIFGQAENLAAQVMTFENNLPMHLNRFPVWTEKYESYHFT